MNCKSIFLPALWRWIKVYGDNYKAQAVTLGLSNTEGKDCLAL